MALPSHSTPSDYKSCQTSIPLVLSVLIGHEALVMGAEQYVVRRGETLEIRSGSTVHITGDGGYIRLLGSGAVLIDVSPQSLYQYASGETTTKGNVEEGVSQHGSGAMTIHGTVRGGLELAGSGAITVNGDLYGPVRHTGTGALVVNGRRHA